jgi:hypothetical protein
MTKAVSDRGRDRRFSLLNTSNRFRVNFISSRTQNRVGTGANVDVVTKSEANAASAHDKPFFDPHECFRRIVRSAVS